VLEFLGTHVAGKVLDCTVRQGVHREGLEQYYESDELKPEAPPRH
jgi:hypothetical protein